MNQAVSPCPGAFTVVTLIRANLSEVAAAVRMAFEGNGLTFRQRTAPLDLEGVSVARRQKTASSPMLACFFRPTLQPGATVMIATPRDGWFTLACSMGRHLQGEIYMLELDRPNVSYMFELQQHGKTVRHVHLQLDDRLIFWQTGAPLSVEVAEDYKKPIKDRMSVESLLGVSARLGFPLDDVGMWTTEVDAWYVEYHHSWL